MNGKINKIRETFKSFLTEKNGENALRWLNVVDFGLKVLLQSVGELKETQEVYDVTDLERVDDWRNKMRSEQAWQYIDEQNNGLLSKALRQYWKFAERLDLVNNSTKGFQAAKPVGEDDDIDEPEPGVKISKKRQTIFISDGVTEGEATEVTLTKYERSRLARQLCIDAYGGTYSCEVCGLKLADKYGHREDKEDYIEVHHIVEHAEKSKQSGSHEVNYRKEMIPLCPNCHRMIHQLKDHTISPDELRDIIHDYEHKK